MVKKIISIFPLLILIIFLSCNFDSNNNGDPALARVTFINHSTYDVDVFYNFNPQYITEAALVGTVDIMSRTLTASFPASQDTFLGDTFYLRFKIRLANMFETGTTNILIHAERTMSNIPIVLEIGHNYTLNIHDPPIDELRFINGYIRVQNITTELFWVENHSTILTPLANEAAWLAPGQIGFFELSLPPLADSWPMEFLQIRDSQVNRTPFPAFTMERGKLYWYEINNTGIVPTQVTNINPLAN